MRISAITELSASDQTQKPRADLLKRSLVAVPALLLFASVIYFHGLYAKITVSIIHLICVHEIVSAISAVAAPLRALCYGFAIALLPAYEYSGGQAGVSSLLTICLLCLFAALILCRRTVPDGLYTILTMLYPGLLFASVYDILSVPDVRISQFLLILAFGCAIVTDSFAYFGGRTFGRHTLIERISPHKTVEGAACGLVFGTLFVVLFGSQVQSAFGAQLSSTLYLAWGVLLSLLSQIGDLSASYLKRWFGIKDFGKIWGPHGGMLDRLDSMLFLAPVAYLFYRISLA